MNEVMRILTNRASLRNFSDEPVTDEELDQVLAASLHGASGGNLQPFSIITVRDRDTSSWLGEKSEQEFIGKAPVNLIYCIDWKRMADWCRIDAAPFSADRSFPHFWISFQDTVIAAQNACVAADSLELGTVYIGTIMEFWDECREKFNLPQGVIPVVLVCLGHPGSADHPKTSPKLPMSLVVHSEKYQKPQDEELLKGMRSRYHFEGQRNPGEEAVKTVENACLVSEGPELAERFKRSVEETGMINVPQYIFGLHYSAAEMHLSNQDYIEAMKRAGLDFFSAH